MELLLFFIGLFVVGLTSLCIYAGTRPHDLSKLFLGIGFIYLSFIIKEER